MNQDQNDSREPGPVVETPAQPPRLIWLLLPLSIAAGLFAWGVQLGRPDLDGFWRVAEDHADQAERHAAPNSDRPAALPLPALAVNQPPQDVLRESLGGAERTVATPVVLSPASAAISDGVLTVIDPVAPPSIARAVVPPARSMPPEVALVEALRAG